MEGVLALAEPITAFADGEAVVLNQDEVSGKVVLIKRGEISFYEKALAAQQVGAVGVLIANNNQQNPNAVEDRMAGGGEDEIHVPVVMISYSEGERAVELGAGTPVAIAGLDVEIDT